MIAGAQSLSWMGRQGESGARVNDWRTFVLSFSW